MDAGGGAIPGVVKVLRRCAPARSRYALNGVGFARRQRVMIWPVSLALLTTIAASFGPGACATATAAQSGVISASVVGTQWILPSGIPSSSDRQPVLTSVGRMSTMVWADFVDLSADKLYCAVQSTPWSGWSSPELLDAHLVNAMYRMVTGADGTTALVWLRRDDSAHQSLRMRMKGPASDSWGPEMALASIATTQSVGVADMRVHVAPSGAVTTVWSESAYLFGPLTLYERTWDPVTRLLGDRRTIQSNSGGILLDLTGGPNGQLTLAFPGSPGYLVTSLEPGASSWSSPIDLDPGGWSYWHGSYIVRVKTNAAGTTLATFSQASTSFGGASRNSLYARIRPAGSDVWSEPILLDSVDDMGFVFDPTLSLNADGGFLVLAGRRLTETTRAIVAYDIDSSGNVLASTTVHPSGAWSEAFELAGDEHGRAVVLFDVGSRDYDRETSLYVTARTGLGAGWTAPRLLSDTARKTENDSGGFMQHGGYWAPSASVSAHGDLMVAWREKAAVRSAALLASPLTVIPVQRIAGEDRYATSVRTSESGFPAGAGTVVVATGENWPDALTAGVLAVKAGGPLLLTRKASVPSAVSAEIIRLKATKAYIIGGDGAVGREVEDALQELGVEVVRLGGLNRYETAGLVADEVVRLAGPPAGYFIASGEAFPDALSAVPVAARLGYPILLTGGSTLPAATADRIPIEAKVIIVGGDGAVSPSIYERFPDRIRLYGGDRYRTCTAIASWAISSHPDVFTASTVGVATGRNYPDALGGGPFMAGKNGVLLLVPTSPSAPFTWFVDSKWEEIRGATVFGGTQVVSTLVEDYLQGP